jgi:D-alanyl-D-alanine carboxypeptidase
MHRSLVLLTLVCAAFGLPPHVRAQALTEPQVAAIDQSVAANLAQRDVPSASVAVVRGGQIVFAKAYGHRALSPDRPAEVGARYNIGSVSKQMTATALLMLVDQGKLSLDDPVGRWLPELTEASRITVRQVLSHTAGYKGFFLSETMPVEASRPTTPQSIADRWGRMPLDYPPGTSWQYSNTDYTIAALIVERLTGQPLLTVLRERVFQPLGMTSATAFYGQPMPPQDAQGYTRHALGPFRLAPIVAEGWELGAGGLTMTATDLARWDEGVLGHRLLSAKSYAVQQTRVTLANGKPAPYGLGVFVDEIAGHKRVAHNGSDHGFLTENRIYPDDNAAVVVMVNADFGHAEADIADEIEHLILGGPAPAKRDPRRPRSNVDAAIRPQDLVLARHLIDQLAVGTLDRNLLGPDAQAYFSPTVAADYRDSLAPLGPLVSFERLQAGESGGEATSIYRLMWRDEWLIAILRREPEGRVTSFKIYAPS